MLHQLLKRKADGAFGPLSFAVGAFFRDKELSRRSVISFLRQSNFPDIDASKDDPEAQLDLLLYLTKTTVAQACASKLTAAKARTRIKKLGTLMRIAVENWPTFSLARETALSVLYQTGPQYSFLRWAFLNGGSMQIFNHRDMLQ